MVINILSYICAMPYYTYSSYMSNFDLRSFQIGIFRGRFLGLVFMEQESPRLFRLTAICLTEFIYSTSQIISNRYLLQTS